MERFFGYSGSYYTERISASINSYVTEAARYNYTDFIIRYTLKDGSEVIRRYEYDFYAVMDLLEQIYNDNEYKSAVHPVFSLLESGCPVTHMECYAPTSGVTVKLEKNCTAIVEAYKEDILAMSFDDLKNSAPIGELTVHFTVNEGYAPYEDSSNFLVYPEMTRTLALLREQGVYLQGVQDADHIGTISITYGGSLNDFKRLFGMEVSEEDNVENYDMEMSVAYEDYELYYEKFGYYPQTAWAPEYYQDVVVEFTDPAEIAEIKKCLVYRQYGSEFGPFPETNTYLSAEVYFEMQTGTMEDLLAGEGLIGWTERFRFEEGNIPQFVIDRLLSKLSGEMN